MPPDDSYDDGTLVPCARRPAQPDHKALIERAKQVVDSWPALPSHTEPCAETFVVAALNARDLCNALAQQPAKGWKLLKDSTHPERSWPKDIDAESGGYVCVCYNCGRNFTGHKRRVACRVCEPPTGASHE